MTYFTVRKFTTTGRNSLACFQLQLDFGLLTLLDNTGNIPTPPLMTLPQVAPSLLPSAGLRTRRMIFPLCA